ncbi:MAG: DUF4926 domain-containing protein [Deltaproteobacteria bacterium]|nr:DUF4926 domain-containing protein [Deltaproteobacteria bacterium]
MFQELDMVVLRHDIAEYRLQKGDIGTVVHLYGSGEACEVEFVNAQGDTVALLTLEAKDIRPLQGREILHVRELAQATA